MEGLDDGVTGGGGDPPLRFSSSIMTSNSSELEGEIDEEVEVRVCLLF